MGEDGLRFGILGFGIGSYHADAIRETRLGRVAWICDLDDAKLEDAGRRFPGARLTKDYAEVCTASDVDAVIVATPDHFHFEHASLAVRERKHVLCEKPMVTTFEDAVRLLELVRAAGVTFGVGNVNRFVGQFAEVRRLAASGRLGKLFHVEGDYIHDMRSVYKITPWRCDPVRPQNLWFGGGVHPLDLVRWVGGEVEEVYLAANKCASTPPYPERDNYLATLRLEGGVTGRVWVPCGIVLRPEHDVRLLACGSEGTASAHLHEQSVSLCLPELFPTQTRMVDVHVAGPAGKPLAAELSDFVAAVREGRQPLVDCEDGAKTVAALEAGQRSLERGEPVAPERLPA